MHQKHAKIKRPDSGQFGRNEIAILGTTCSRIKKLSREIIAALSPQFKIAYADADHKSADEAISEKNSAIDFGAWLEYTDKIDFHRFDLNAKLEPYQFRVLCNEADLILVNGNHFPARKQIVIIDPVKFDSLERKLNRLTNVQLFILTDGQSEIPGFLKKHLPDWAEIPILKASNQQLIHEFFAKSLHTAIPPVYGLVLAGGKSQRMGQDKGLIDYHGKPQREHMADLLNSFCARTFLSCRAGQAGEISSAYPVLEDTFTDLGPFGAILSAFREEPEMAWLVVACDLPLLDETTLVELTKKRDSAKLATCYQSPVNKFPEPLVTIWEPKAYPVALQFLAQGYSCPRKVLINSDIKELTIQDANKLLNVNKQEEYEQVKMLLSQQS